MDVKRTISTKQLVLVAFFVALTAIGARLEIPLPYVPFTLQTFFVLLAGMLLGSRLGALSQMLYIVIGLIGLPVFARGGGIGYVVQPTFGYIIGFVPAAFITGRLIESRLQVSRRRFVAASLAGLASVYLLGLLYLWLCTNLILGKELDLFRTLQVGFLVLLPGALIKVLLAAMVGAEVHRRLVREAHRQEH